MEKINVAELLRNCPRGMELDCTICENVYFDYVSELNIIHCYIQYETYRTSIIFNQRGAINSDIKSKCVIFPKGKTTWEGFHRPFKDGDIIYNRLQKKICIYYLCGDEVPRINGCRYNESNIQLQFEKLEYPIPVAIQDYRFATEEEKTKLFQAIKDNGYKWNPETKTLDKLIELIEPKFKVGDTITNGKTSITIGYIDNEYYYEISRNIAHRLFIKNQDDWELVPDKFDITTLKPFDQVLVRDFDNTPWEIEFFSRLLDGKHFKCLELSYMQCIPYEGNEHLLGKKDNCDEYFKTWE